MSADAPPSNERRASAGGLHSLGGGAAPPGLADDLRLLARLPDEAYARFWHVLGPTLRDELGPETEALLDAFAAEHVLDADLLAHAIKASRFLVREAARLDAPSSALGADLEQLCPGEPAIRDLLLAGYERAKAQIRLEITRAALGDHGSVLVAAQWRVDTIQASERGIGIGAPVTLLTLHYREGKKSPRLTLQVLPDMLGELKRICESILS